MTDDQMMMFIMNKMDEKLRELMGEEEHARFSKAIAKEAFLTEVEGMPEGEFKEFCLEKFEEITA